jgi:DNA-binding GntR family transcriptional regulator
MEAKLSRPKSLTELAVDRIRAAIVEGRLTFGAQISESALAAQLGISKTPVREALLRLRSEGLVEVHPQRGTFVFRLADHEVGEICRLREMLESAALAETMAKNREALVARLEANVAAMAEAHRTKNQRALPQLDADFHGAILGLCGNGYLRRAYGLIEHKIHALRWRLPENNDQIEHCQANHAVIVEQIRGGSIATAQAMLAQHIRETQNAYLEANRSEESAIAERLPA